MKNCLVKSYKSVVTNDNLDYFGYLTFSINPGGSAGLILLALTEDGDCKVLGGTINGSNIFSVGTRVAWINSQTIVQTGDEMKLLVPKYIVSNIRFQTGQINFNNFLHSPLTKLEAVGSATEVIPNIEVMNKVQNLSLTSAKILDPCDVTMLGTTKNLTSFSIGGSDNNIIGSLDNLGHCALTEMSVGQHQNLSLSIEKFVANNRLEGRTTGSLSISDLGLINTTFNGGTAGTTGANSLSWDATTITLNGVTITA